MRAYLSTGRIRLTDLTTTDPVELQRRVAYQARVEAMAILSETEPAPVDSRYARFHFNGRPVAPPVIGRHRLPEWARAMSESLAAFVEE